MGALLRLLIGFPVAAVTTVVLFLIMYGLIKQDAPELNEEGETVKITIGRQLEDTSQQINRSDLTPPKLDTPPPPPPALNQADFKPEVAGVQAAQPTINASTEFKSGFNPDRDAQPLVRVPPRYPQNCASRHTKSETVTVEFDVTPDGQVTNVKVINSTNSCFNRATIRAVQRFKYAPKIVDEQAVPRRGVRQVLRYQPPE